MESLNKHNSDFPSIQNESSLNSFQNEKVSELSSEILTETDSKISQLSKYIGLTDFINGEYQKATIQFLKGPATIALSFAVAYWAYTIGCGILSTPNSSDLTPTLPTFPINTPLPKPNSFIAPTPTLIHIPTPSITTSVTPSITPPSNPFFQFNSTGVCTSPNAIFNKDGTFHAFIPSDCALIAGTNQSRSYNDEDARLMYNFYASQGSHYALKACNEESCLQVAKEAYET